MPELPLVKGKPWKVGTKNILRLPLQSGNLRCFSKIRPTLGVENFPKNSRNCAALQRLCLKAKRLASNTSNGSFFVFLVPSNVNTSQKLCQAPEALHFQK